MNITQKDAGELLTVLTIEIVEEDYKDRVNNLLKDYRKKADMKGFRKGMVPMGIVKKMYGTAILVEEINKIVSENLSKHLIDNKVNILGEPLPSETDQKPIDWENQTAFEFAFDIGYAPEFEFDITKEDKVKYYMIAVDDKMIDTQVENFANGYGTMQEKDIVSNESKVTGDIVELDNDGNVVEDGNQATDAMLLVSMIKDEEIKNKFIGANKNEIVSFNLRNAFPNDAEIASLLSVDKKDAENINSDFQITIKGINEQVPMTVGEELFKLVFSDGSVNDEKEFRIKIKEEIAKSLINDSNYRFSVDAKEYILDKIKFNLPVDFLKRWLDAVNEKLTREEIDRDWTGFEADLRWQLIKSKFAKEQNIEVDEKKVLAEAKVATMAQLQQYGMNNLPDEQVDVFAKQLLENKEQANQLEERVYENEIMSLLRGIVTLKKKEISSNEFQKLFTPEAAIPTKKVELEDEAAKE